MRFETQIRRRTSPAGLAGAVPWPSAVPEPVPGHCGLELGQLGQEPQSFGPLPRIMTSTAAFFRATAQQRLFNQHKGVSMHVQHMTEEFQNGS